MIDSQQNVDLSGYQKILFRLQRDADGYPPNEWETLWAKELGQDLFQIDNVPFFVRGISDGDTVLATFREDEYHFVRVVKRSKNSVIRVMVYEGEDVQALRDQLSTLGCESELSHIARLFSVHIPASVSISEVRALLDKGEQEERWSYEEGSLRHA